MGIRFYCPKGHKLNVKSDLAGKVGVCPKCGERMLIPLADTREGQHSSIANVSDHGESEVPNQIGEEVATIETTDFAPQDHQDHNDAVFANGATATNLPELSRTDPSLLWYVRGADDQTYGPVAGNVIGQWIQEKRVGPTMFVWHEGWENWVEARTVFPELEALFATPAVDKLPQATFPGRPSPPNSQSEVAPIQSSSVNEIAGAINRKKKVSRDLMIVIGLITVIVCLIVVLVAILVSQNSSSRESSQRLPVVIPHKPIVDRPFDTP